MAPGAVLDLDDVDAALALYDHHARHSAAGMALGLIACRDGRYSVAIPRLLDMPDIAHRFGCADKSGLFRG